MFAVKIIGIIYLWLCLRAYFIYSWPPFKLLPTCLHSKWWKRPPYSSVNVSCPVFQKFFLIETCTSNVPRNRQTPNYSMPTQSCRPSCSKSIHGLTQINKTIELQLGVFISGSDDILHHLTVKLLKKGFGHTFMLQRLKPFFVDFKQK